MLTLGNVVVTALLSGLVATCVTIWYQRRTEVRRMKLEVFQRLLGSRHVLLPGPHDPGQAARFSEAFNQVFIVFHDSQEVISALKGFYEATMTGPRQNELANERLLELLKSMAKHLSIRMEVLGDSFIMRAFNVGSATPQQLDFHFQGAAVINGQLGVVGSLPLSGDQRMPIFFPVGLAHSLGCTLIEIANLARQNEGELRRTGEVFDVGRLGPEFARRLQQRQEQNRR